MSAKTEQLQIRVSPRQKAALKAAARAAGCDVSRYVLARALPDTDDRFGDILDALRDGDQPQFALAELNDFLTGCPPVQFGDALRDASLDALEPWLRNYVAAMVEQAAHLKGVAAPRWTASVAPLETPRFVTPLAALRTHLLLASHVPFKRRNIFVDATVGARV